MSVFKQFAQNIETFIITETTEPILAQFCTTIKTTKYIARGGHQYASNKLKMVNGCHLVNGKIVMGLSA